MSVSARRVLFHVQHLLGIGHQRRAAALVGALRREGLAVTVLTGDTGGEAADYGGAEIARLPAIRALDPSFKTLVDAAGRPIDDAFRARRRARVLEVFTQVAPHVFLIEGFPFARRAFRFELEPLIAAARGALPRPAIVCSVRDVLVEKPDVARRLATVATVQRDFDLVLVHGDPRLIAFAATFPEAGEIAAKLRYTGYVRDDWPLAGPTTEGAGEVLVSVGGGAVGERLLRTALAARPLSQAAGRRWRLLAGPNLPAPSYAALAADLPPGVVLDRFRADFPALLRRCAVSVSQAGYNTVLDILAARARAVLVPFAAEREPEQGRRAERLAELGLVRVLGETELSAERLAGAIDAALAAPLPPAPRLDFGGAAATAKLLAALAVQRYGPAAGS